MNHKKQNEILSKMLKRFEYEYEIFCPTAYWKKLTDEELRQRLFPSNFSEENYLIKVPTTEEADMIEWQSFISEKKIKLPKNEHPMFYVTSSSLSLEEFQQYYRERNLQMEHNIVTYMDMIAKFDEPMPKFTLSNDELCIYENYHDLRIAIPKEKLKQQRKLLKQIFSKTKIKDPDYQNDLFIAYYVDKNYGDPYSRSSDNEWRGNLYSTLKQVSICQGDSKFWRYNMLNICDYNSEQRKIIFDMIKKLKNEMQEYPIENQIALFMNFFPTLFEIYNENTQQLDLSQLAGDLGKQIKKTYQVPKKPKNTD